MKNNVVKSAIIFLLELVHIHFRYVEIPLAIVALNLFDMLFSEYKFIINLFFFSKVIVESILFMFMIVSIFVIFIAQFINTLQVAVKFCG